MSPRGSLANFGGKRAAPFGKSKPQPKKVAAKKK